MLFYGNTNINAQKRNPKYLENSWKISFPVYVKQLTKLCLTYSHFGILLDNIDVLCNPTFHLISLPGVPAPIIPQSIPNECRKHPGFAVFGRVLVALDEVHMPISFPPLQSIIWCVTIQGINPIQHPTYHPWMLRSLYQAIVVLGANKVEHLVVQPESCLVNREGEVENTARLWRQPFGSIFYGTEKEQRDLIAVIVALCVTLKQLSKRHVLFKTLSICIPEGILPEKEENDILNYVTRDHHTAIALYKSYGGLEVARIHSLNEQNSHKSVLRSLADV